MIKNRLLLCIFIGLMIFPLRLSAQIVLPPIMVLSFNNGYGDNPYYNDNLPDSNTYAKSTLVSILEEKDIVSEDYHIYGAVYTNCLYNQCSGSEKVFLQLSQDEIPLYNGIDEIKVKLSAFVGGVSFGMKPQDIDSVKIEKDPKHKETPYKADIEIIGDIDEGSVDITKSTGLYRGVFTITATLL